jgi:hypothetical protein
MTLLIVAAEAFVAVTAGTLVMHQVIFGERIKMKKRVTAVIGVEKPVPIRQQELSAPLYQRAINGYKGKVESQVRTEPGNIGEELANAIETRKCPHNPRCTPTNFDRDCPSLLTVVILEEETVCGCKNAKIVGFATFLLSEVNKDTKSVTGYFIERTVPKNSEFVIDPGGEDFGLVASRLIK